MRSGAGATRRPGGGRDWLPWAALLLIAVSPPARAADDRTSDDSNDAEAADPAVSRARPWAIHGQATAVVQGLPAFRSPYEGPNSLQPRQLRENADATLFVGVRPWAQGELWVNPELDQGRGLSDTLGAGGYPNAEAFKVGQAQPRLHIQRLFLRQTINLGPVTEAVAADENRLAGRRATRRLVLTLGKFNLADVFDGNGYAHDPRSDFLNLALVAAGTFDYAANAWGYAQGAAAEWISGAWTWRVGVFALPRTPGGEQLEPGLRQFQIDAEVEHRHHIAGRPGAIRLTAFRSQGHFARFDEAVAQARASGQPADTALVRHRLSRPGVSLNAEQEITDTLGLFLRAGIADGAVETAAFSDIDRTVALGGVWSGQAWHRPRDRIGLAMALNGISAAHRQYLRQGGTDLLVGDGQLPHAGGEYVWESYYAWQPGQSSTITVDYQLLTNPGYNSDRGPASVFSLRLHRDF